MTGCAFLEDAGRLRVPVPARCWRRGLLPPQPASRHAEPPAVHAVMKWKLESETRTRWSQHQCQGNWDWCAPGSATPASLCALVKDSSQVALVRCRTMSSGRIPLPQFFPGVPLFHTLCAFPDSLLPPLYVALLYSMECSDSIAALSK